MGGVSDSADGLTDHVNFPVSGFAPGQQCVQSPGGGPHDITASFIILGIRSRDPGAVDQGLHQAFRQVVGGVVVLAGEVLLADVGHDIEESGNHLVAGDGQGIGGIQDGELGHDLIAENVSDLQFLFGMGDDGAAVHLGAGAHHGQDAANGNDLIAQPLHADIVFLPGVVVAVSGDGQGLGVVTDGPAADRQNQVNFVGFCQFTALIQLVDRGVGHDAGQFEDCLVVHLKDLDDLVIDAVFLDGPAAVSQQDVGSVFLQLPVQVFQGVVAEVKSGGVAVTEIS